MTKNTKGGAKHKKYAKNKIDNGPINIKSIVKDSEFQTYGYITKVLGNCRFDIDSWDGIKRIGHVRGKIRKRSWCILGDLVLISLRDFQDDKCDIIKKYTDEEVQLLLKENEISESFIKKGFTIFSNNNIIDNEFLFTNSDSEFNRNKCKNNLDNNSDQSSNSLSIEFEDI